MNISISTDGKNWTDIKNQVVRIPPQQECSHGIEFVLSESHMSTLEGDIYLQCICGVDDQFAPVEGTESTFNCGNCGRDVVAETIE